jgi:biotin operon repressor
MLIQHLFTRLIQSVNNLFSKQVDQISEGFTQQQKALALLQLNTELSGNELRASGVNNPRARIKDLRDKGYCITSTRKKVANGNSKFTSVVYYKLN